MGHGSFVSYSQGSKVVDESPFGVGASSKVELSFEGSVF